VSEGSAKKEDRRKFQAIKGTRDLLPPETALWNRVEQTAHEVFATFGFGEIRVPVFEPTDLFARSIGLDTDVVSKEMYTFLDPPAWLEILEKIGTVKDVDRTETTFTIKNHRPNENFIAEVLSLRPEATASVCRAYIEHGMQQLPHPVKLYYIGPMFRRERPQKGRYRQFYQIGAEVLGGSDAPAIDAEVIEMVMTYFDRLELQGVQLDINSIGCRECRPKYVEVLRAELQKVKNKLGLDSQRRIETNPLRVLDSKVDTEQATIEKLPRIGDHLCKDCAEHYAAVKRELALRGAKYRENWRLVRGLDYYMRTTFEITAAGLGSQNAVCGGGRYDGLVELLGGPPTKGIGFAIGTDRLVLSLQETSSSSSTARATNASVALGADRIDVYVAWMGDAAYPAAVRIARGLREAGLRVELPPGDAKLGKSLGLADKLGARYAVIIGENEVASGEFIVKRLADSEQKKVREGEWVAAVGAK
jgi:histidyl-tRNA synthetase